MGLPSALVFSLFMVSATISLSLATEQNQNSAVSTILCDDMAQMQVDFQIHIHLKNGRIITVRLTGNTPLDAELTNVLDEKVPHTDMEFVKISSAMKEICFYSVVIDTLSFIDLPTVVKTSCEEWKDEKESSFQRCRKFESKIEPALVCQQTLTSFLKVKKVIEPDAEPDQSGRKEFETPEYDIIGDMSQASKTIAEGLAEGARQFVKNRKKVTQVAKVAKVLGTFAKFLKAAGPLFNALGGIASILTSFLTPNPFDEMVKYMKKEFDKLHRRLDRMEKELVNVMEKQGALIRMADKLDIIRYSMRDYGAMVRSLSKQRVCGVNDLLENNEVKAFLRDYVAHDTEQRLLDLFEVEQGGILGTPSLLDPYMRANCVSRPHKVKRFMNEVSNYAVHGTRAYMAFKTIECLRNGNQNCEIKMEELDNGFAKKLYMLLNKANTLKIAVDDRAMGLYLDFKNKYLEVKTQMEKEYWGDKRDLYSGEERREFERQFAGQYLFPAVKDAFFHKLFDRDSWAQSCIIDATDNLVLAVVAQSDASSDDPDFLPWNLDSPSPRRPLIRFDNAAMKIKDIPKAYTLKTFPKGQNDINCDDGLPMLDLSPCTAKASGADPPERDPSDRIVYLEYNHMIERLHVTIVKLDVYNKPGYYLGSKRIKLGCWHGESDHAEYQCPPLDQPNLSRKKVRYFAIIDHSSR